MGSSLASVDWKRAPVKNTQSRRVRNRTSGPNRPETPDRRVQKTKKSLRDALIGLAREKPYDSIGVKEVLDRANVGRSTFYAHFSGKDDLLESGIPHILRSSPSPPHSGEPREQLVAFSLPILEYIDQHRRANGPVMTRQGQIAMHEHLRDVLTSVITVDLATAMPPGQASPQLPADLIARHVASTFVLVLNWWIESRTMLTPQEVDARFRTLVLPSLATLRGSR